MLLNFLSKSLKVRAYIPKKQTKRTYFANKRHSLQFYNVPARLVAHNMEKLEQIFRQTYNSTIKVSELKGNEHKLKELLNTFSKIEDNKCKDIVIKHIITNNQSLDSFDSKLIFFCYVVSQNESFKVSAEVFDSLLPKVDDNVFTIKWYYMKDPNKLHTFRAVFTQSPHHAILSGDFPDYEFYDNHLHSRCYAPCC